MLPITEALVNELQELAAAPPGGEFSLSATWVQGAGLCILLFAPVGMELSLEAHESWVTTALGRGRS